jgi:electron transport complex protein RnfG
MAMSDRPRALLLLACVAAGGAALVAGSYELSRERIEENQRQQLISSLNSVFPAELHDNDLSRARIQLDGAELLGTLTPIDAFLARRGAAVVGVLLSVVAPDGYNGPIRLLIGILPDGTVTGVRVVSHRETPGLGDGIDLAKSDWVLQFDGRRLDATATLDWNVRLESGDFDALTGATVTPRAVIHAVRDALRYFDEQRTALLSIPPPESTTEVTTAEP